MQQPRCYLCCRSPSNFLGCSHPRTELTYNGTLKTHKLRVTFYVVILLTLCPYKFSMLLLSFATFFSKSIVKKTFEEFTLKASNDLGSNCLQSRRQRCINLDNHLLQLGMYMNEIIVWYSMPSGEVCLA